MTTPRSPQGEMVDIMDLDQEIDALLRGHGAPTDEGLGLLLELRDSVELRAAGLLGDRERASPGLRPSVRQAQPSVAAATGWQSSLPLPRSCSPRPGLPQLSRAHRELPSTRCIA